MSTATEHSVLVYGHGPGRDEPELQPVEDPETAAELVLELALQGVTAKVVCRQVGPWLPDEPALKALADLRCTHVLDTIQEYLEGERTTEEADELLERHSPDLGSILRRHWIRELANLLLLRTRLDEDPEWLVARITQATFVLAGQLAPGHLN